MRREVTSSGLTPSPTRATIVRRAIAVAATAAAGLFGLAGPAFAGAGSGGDTTGGGYGARAVDVQLSGDYDPGLVSSVPGPPPLCWWEPISTLGWGVDPNDPKAVKDYWFKNVVPNTEGSDSAAGRLSVGSDTKFQQAIDAAKNGQKVTWYTLQYDDTRVSGGDGSVGAHNKGTAKLRAAGCGSGVENGPFGLQVLVTLDFFPTGDPPAPVVDPKTLADYAYRVMDLVKPTLDWNPQVAKLDDATITNFPTWLWTHDQAAVHDRTVTATAGNVSVTVTASTDGLSVTSPAGTTECSADQAATAYARSESQGSACSLTFNRASYGYPKGFPVEASTVWDASWTSNTGEGGDLDAKTVGATTYIPVADVQTVDTGVN